MRCASADHVMQDEHKQKIDQIMAGMQCSKNFKCAEAGLEHLCRARDFGVEDYLDCLDER